MKKMVCTLLPLLCYLISHAQSPVVQWQKSFGGTDAEACFALQQTADSGYIACGWTKSSNGDLTANHGSSDCWVVKLSATGSIQWQKIFGGSGMDEADAIQQTADGGYIVVAATYSYDGDVADKIDSLSKDIWVLKLSPVGSIEWQKIYGGHGNESAYSVQQTSDNGYIISGYTASTDGAVTASYGNGDSWVLKISATGALQWQKSLGGTGNDVAHAVLQTFDSGYIVAGGTSSNDHDVSVNKGADDYWVVKLSALGNIVWEKTYGGTSAEYATGIAQTSDGGYIVTGVSSSADGDITSANGAQDIWVIRLSSTGGLLWERSLGGSAADYSGFTIRQMTDGGFLVCGITYSADSGITGNHGAEDYFVAKLDVSGNIIWQDCFGGSNGDGATSALPISGDRYVVAGSSSSNDGNVTGNHGDYDFWIMAFTPSSNTGISSPARAMPVCLKPNPARDVLFIEGIDAATVHIYSINGQLQIETTTNSISIASLAPGIYIARVVSNTGELLYNGKLVKE